MLDRIEAAGQSFFRQSMGERCVFTVPIFRPHFSKTFFTLRRTVQGACGQIRCLLILRSLKLTLTLRVGVCVFQWFKTDILHVTYWRRWDVIHKFSALLSVKFSSMRLPHKETQSTPWWLQWYWTKWAMNLEGYKRKWLQSLWLEYVLHYNNRADRTRKDVSKLQDMVSSLNKFTFHLSLK
jgi:hypothetical protein